MQFALNYSPEALTLSADGQIAVDLYKLPDWPDLVREVAAEHSLYVHFSLRAGSPSKRDDTFIEWALENTATRFVNVHLGVWRDAMPDTDILDLSPQTIDTVRERIRADLKALVARYGKERVIAENLFTLDRPGGVPMLAGSLPEVITDVIEDADCGFLLDTAHAKVAAFSHGLPTKDYINQLPISRLRELHVTGVGFRDDGRLGDHLPMRADDWQVYEWATTQMHSNPAWRTPDVVACEYGGVGELFRPYSRADVIATEIPRMVALARGAVTA